MPVDLQRAGQRTLQHGDLTGARQIAVLEEAKEQASAVDRAVLELKSADTQLEWVSIPGRSSVYPIPREVYLALTKREFAR